MCVCVCECMCTNARGPGQEWGAQRSRSGGQRREACRGKCERREPCERGKVLEMGMITKQESLPTDPVFRENHPLISSTLLVWTRPQREQNQGESWAWTRCLSVSSHKLWLSAQIYSLKSASLTDLRPTSGLEPSAFQGQGVRRKDELRGSGLQGGPSLLRAGKPW